LKVDVTAEADLIAAVKLAEREFGLLNVVVANAGIAGSGTSKTLEEDTDDEWDHH
jgi:NAD(P)-dependent dehydrogenase (short-subunit alcohol dehydrogenase family)